MQHKDTLAIITARGGSKRIPRKNIKDFLGKPIITYSIKTAIESKIFDTIMVSTDDEEIADIAKQYGAEVPFMRSEKNANDFVGTTGVLIEVLNKYIDLENEFDYACCIYPTAPFITTGKLKSAFHLLKEKNFDTVFPVVRFSYPIQRALKINEAGYVKMFQPENRKKRSQDLEPAYHDAGQFYFFKVPEFFKYKKLWTNNTGCIVLPETEVQDIDNELDWKLAELKFQL